MIRIPRLTLMVYRIFIQILPVSNQLDLFHLKSLFPFPACLYNQVKETKQNERNVIDKVLYIWDIEKIIKNTLAEHRLNINYEFNNKLNAPMNYNVSTNTIKFNYLQVNGYIAKINFKIRETEENIVKLLLYHEIGYYLDFKKNKHDIRTLMYGEDEEIEQLMSEIERNSWEYGRILVPDHLVNAYDQVRELDKLLLKSR
jgi:hypothetical protein